MVCDVCKSMHAYTHLGLYLEALARHPLRPSCHHLSSKRWCWRRTDTSSSLWWGCCNSPSTWEAEKHLVTLDMRCHNHQHSWTLRPKIPDDTVKAADLLVGVDSLVFAREVLNAGCSVVFDLQRGCWVLQTHRWALLNWWRRWERDGWENALYAL